MSSLHQLAAPPPGAFAGLSEEHEEFRRSVRPFLERLSPEAEVRRLMATTDGYDPAGWRQLADQLGLQGLIIPEEHGGSGYSFAELGIALEEMGRVLLCAPFFATAVLATPALLLAGDAGACAEYLPPIATGDLIATVALAGESGRWDRPGAGIRAVPDGYGWRLEGAADFVPDGHVAGLLLIPARTDGPVVRDAAAGDAAAGDAAAAGPAAGGAVSLLAVAGDAAGLSRTPLPVMDQTRKQARLELDGTPARLVGAPGGAGPALARLLDLAAVGLAAESAGAAGRCLEMAVGYAKVRTQFGRPIGSFQAIKHKCADVLLEVETARAAASRALAAAAAGDPELPAIASLAGAWCAEALAHAAAENIQVHGGIGFTWEHPAHLYYKRAVASGLMLGDPRQHRLAFADRIGL